MHNETDEEKIYFTFQQSNTQYHHLEKYTKSDQIEKNTINGNKNRTKSAKKQSLTSIFLHLPTSNCSKPNTLTNIPHSAYNNKVNNKVKEEEKQKFNNLAVVFILMYFAQLLIFLIIMVDYIRLYWIGYCCNFLIVLISLDQVVFIL